MKPQHFNFILIIVIIILVLKDGYFTKLKKNIFKQVQTQDNVINSSYYWFQKFEIYQGFDCQNKIVFLGTSLFDDIDMNELFNRNDIVNRGIGGDITHGVLIRVNHYIMQKPKCIFLKIGVNDIFWGFNMDTIRSNYFQIVKKIVDKKIPLFILSTNQVSENFKNHKKINSQVVELNNYLIQLSTDLNLTYVDINSNLTNSSGLKNRFTPDGIHLNLLGYMSFKKSIEPFLNNIN